jgi:hypothetical protein
MIAGDDLHDGSSGIGSMIFAVRLLHGKCGDPIPGRVGGQEAICLFVSRTRAYAFTMLAFPLNALSILVLLATLASVGLAPEARAEAQRVAPSVLPEALRQQWNDLRPSFNENSRCAAVWDAGGDAARQALKCSIYMRMGSEAERRALAACDEFRQEHKIRSACRLVVP